MTSNLPHTATAVLTGIILPQGLLGLAVKTHLSANHILGAAVFARKCKEIEQSVPSSLTDDLEVEHRSYAIGAPIEAAAYLEAAINEFYAAAVDKNPHVFGQDTVLPELMSGVWEDVEGCSILAKYQTALTLARKPKFDKGKSPLQEVANLVALRNALVHYKPEWDNQLVGHKGIEDRLKKAFPLNPFAAKDKAFFPSKCLGYGCATWSVRTAWAFVKEFYVRLGLHYWALGHEHRITSI